MTLTNYIHCSQNKKICINYCHRERELMGFPNICRLYEDYYSSFILRKTTILVLILHVMYQNKWCNIDIWLIYRNQIHQSIVGLHNFDTIFCIFQDIGTHVKSRIRDTNILKIPGMTTYFNISPIFMTVFFPLEFRLGKFGHITFT